MFFAGGVDNGLRIALLMAILRQLVMEVHDRKTAGTKHPIFTPGESGFALIQLKVPFQCPVKSMLSPKPFLAQVGLHGLDLQTDGVRATGQQ